MLYDDDVVRILFRVVYIPTENPWVLIFILQSMRPIKGKKFYLHLSIWIYGIILINIPNFNITVGNFDSGDGTLLVPSFYGTLFNAMIFYGNWKFLLKVYGLKQLSYWGLILLGLFSITFLESKIDQLFILERLGDKSIGFWFGIFIDNLFFHIIFFLLPSYGFWSYENYSKIKKEQRWLQEEKLQAELSLMRSQINPHFLFNILNNLFVSAHNFGDTKTANGISNLAEMMRYMLYDSTEDKVPLEKEINYIEDFIELQKFRFSESDEVTIQYTNSIKNGESLRIPPMLFIPFVENAFKHGISLENQSWISIGFAMEQNQLVFSCRNSLHRKQTIQNSHSGFGLKNIKERLKLLYPDQNVLDIQTQDNMYSVLLKLNLR